jgi:peptidoglycan/xylan/chitin deacetylase (PgdA/CDA1 family)
MPADVEWSFAMVPEMLRYLLPAGWAHRAFASLSKLTFGSTGAILMFHEVQEDPDGELRTGCSPGFLDALVRGLIAAGWDIVTLEEALRRIRHQTGNRFVVITFDDGYCDTFSHARPILERYSAPFTVYVPTAGITRELNAWWLGLRSIFRTHDVVRIDAMERTFVCSSLPGKVKALRQTIAWVAQDFSVLPMLCETFQVYRVNMEELVARYCFDSETLKQLSRSPLVTIGGHTSSHRPLALLDEQQMLEEIEDNRGFLEGMLDTKVDHLSYPYGTVQTCGEREFATSLRLGFLSAVTAEKKNLHRRHTQPHRLPRVDVTGRSWRGICNDTSHDVRPEPSTVPNRSEADRSHIGTSMIGTSGETSGG